MTTFSAAEPLASPPFVCLAVDDDFFAQAPQRLLTEADLDVTPGRLFEILDDEASWPVWARPGIRQVTWTSPRPHAAGATRTVAMVGGLEVFERFFRWRDGEELAFDLTGATQKVWIRFAERYVVTRTASGGSHLAWTVAYEPAGGFARVQFLARPLMALTFRRYLRNLAKYCRAHPG